MAQLELPLGTSIRLNMHDEGDIGMYRWEVELPPSLSATLALVGSRDEQLTQVVAWTRGVTERLGTITQERVAPIDQWYNGRTDCSVYFCGAVLDVPEKQGKDYRAWRDAADVVIEYSGSRLWRCYHSGTPDDERLREPSVDDLRALRHVELTVGILLDSCTLSVGRPITGELHIQNTGRSRIRLGPWDTRDNLGLLASGKSVESTVRPGRGSPPSPPSRWLMPGESVLERFELHTNEWSATSWSRVFRVEPGLYEVSFSDFISSRNIPIRSDQVEVQIHGLLARVVPEVVELRARGSVLFLVLDDGALIRLGPQELNPTRVDLQGRSSRPVAQAGGVAISPNGRTVAFGVRGGGKVQLCEIDGSSLEWRDLVPVDSCAEVLGFLDEESHLLLRQKERLLVVDSAEGQGVASSDGWLNPRLTSNGRLVVDVPHPLALILSQVEGSEPAALRVAVAADLTPLQSIPIGKINANSIADMGQNGIYFFGPTSEVVDYFDLIGGESHRYQVPGVLSISESADGSLVSFQRKTGDVEVWNVVTGDLKTRISAKAGSLSVLLGQDPCVVVLMSPADEASQARQATEYNVETGLPIRTLDIFERGLQAPTR